MSFKLHFPISNKFSKTQKKYYKKFQASSEDINGKIHTRIPFARKEFEPKFKSAINRKHQNKMIDFKVKLADRCIKQAGACVTRLGLRITSRNSERDSGVDENSLWLCVFI